ncbi:13956_t:CDS:2, partial [Rhizophagus irregularis]
MEFINAPVGQNNNLATESHPHAYYTSRLHDFTSKQLNEILKSRSQSTSGKVNEENEESQDSVKVNEMLVSKDLDDCIVNLKSLGINLMGEEVGIIANGRGADRLHSVIEP